MAHARLLLPMFLAAALAGCGGSASVPSTPASPVSSVPAAAASAAVKPSASTAATSASAKPAAGSAAASAKPAASASGAASAAANPAASGAALKIGAILPLTGPLSLNGKDNQDAMNLYLESTNGQLGGRKIDLVYADDAAQPDTGLTKARQLVESDKVSLLIGLQSSQVCYAIAGYIRDSKIPAMATADCAAQDLTTNPKYASPYFVRTLSPILDATDPSADYVYKAGFRKAIVMTSDFVAGIQYSDLFSSAFIARGGTVVQELHPPLGTNDMGPYLSQLNGDADVLVLFVGGTDGLRLAQQYPNYVGNRKLQVFDMSSQTSNGPKRNELGPAAAGLIAQSAYMEALNTPSNQNFLKLWYAKHPNQPPSQENAFGWTGMQFLDEALKKAGGDMSDTQKFLSGLYTTSVDTPRGTIKLDEHHDAITDSFVYQLEKSGNNVTEKPLQTYGAIGQFWDRTPEQIEKFQLGQLKGKWVGMTKDKLGDVITLPK
jgi:branched-chain amino acid transport system substrate-binding protein